MVADSLAVALAERYVKQGDYVCDPFCGSGRLLAASARMADPCVGIDVNPLAVLLSRAKFARPRISRLRQLHSELRPEMRAGRTGNGLALRGGRKVAWFSQKASIEVGSIIEWINSHDLSESERLIVAAAASAAFRDASYISKRSWKLHRIEAVRRSAHRVSAWDCFERRLGYCLAELETSEKLRAQPLILQLGAAMALGAIANSDRRGTFDVVMTSPPYGDSETTVQYGAASEILLDCVSRISGMEKLFVPGRVVDNRCLGGATTLHTTPHSFDLHPYWAGAVASPQAKAVAHFLEDFAQSCGAAASCLKSTGTLILVVGRRTTGGYRVKLDEFAVDTLQKKGMVLTEKFVRRIQSKRLPRTINRFGHAASKQTRGQGVVRTMTEEIIVVFRKT